MTMNGTLGLLTRDEVQSPRSGAERTDRMVRDNASLAMTAIMTHRVAPRDALSRDALERCLPDDRTSLSFDGTAAPFQVGASSVLSKRDAQSTSGSPRQGDAVHVRRRDRRIALDLLLWCVICFTLALSLASCGPIPCASGYPDPCWCEHGAGGGGG